MPLRINGFSLIQLDKILGPVIRKTWTADDWAADEIKKFTNPSFTVKIFTAAKTGVLPKSMDFDTARCVFIPVPLKVEHVLVLYTNRSGRSIEMDRLWCKARQLVADYGQEDDLHLLVASIKDWATRQHSRGKRSRNRLVEQVSEKRIRSLT